ncbi:MAG: menaquinone biosynthesis prenyltransferase MqnP [Campylobacterota bacterium]|nr:menaquinone biosynthesis prenyltransferase MqnP [Campylobacterota bacterium]
MNHFLSKLKAFNELIMFQHSIFSLPFIFIAMIVSANGWFGWELFGLGLLAAITARNFAMGLNRYADIDIDAKNPRTQNRPNVDGRLSKNSIFLFTLANAFGFVIVAYFVNSLAFWMSFPILFVLGSYSYFKRFSELAHLVLGISLGLAPIAGVVAVEAAIPMWSVLLGIGVMFWVAGFDLLYSLQDMDFDKERGLFSIPSRYGAEATLFIAALFHVIAVIFWIFFTWDASLGLFAWVAVVFSANMLFYEHKLVRKDFTKIDRAFFTVNGYLGIIFLILIILDRSFS